MFSTSPRYSSIVAIQRFNFIWFVEQSKLGEPDKKLLTSLLLMSGIKSDPASYIYHDVANRVAIVEGYAEISDLTGEEYREQLEAADNFRTAYKRFEIVLDEEDVFDEELIEQMRETGPFYDDIVDRNATSTLCCIDSVRSLVKEEGEKEPVESILDAVSNYGNVSYINDVTDVELDAAYGAVISTKICDYQKHAREENPDAEMFAEVSDSGDALRILIGDTGPGIDAGEQSVDGKGTEIIEEVLEGRDASFTVYDNQQKEEVDGPLIYPEQEVGALFQLQIGEVSNQLRNRRIEETR
jgi:hypothetical protein